MMVSSESVRALVKIGKFTGCEISVDYLGELCLACAINRVSKCPRASWARHSWSR
jgi:hypothetical protein